MTRLAQKAAVLTAIGLLAAAVAMAGVPNSGQSNLNNGSAATQVGILTLGGTNAGGTTVEPLCEKQVLVKDAAGNVVANSVVVINFTNCYAGGDVHIAATQPFVSAGGQGLTVNCAARTVSATTNGSGIAVFRVLGYSNITAGSAAGAGEGCATVTADGVPLGSYSVATPDLNGAVSPVAPVNLGVGGGDTALFNQNRFGGAGYRPRENYSSNAPNPQAIDGGDTAVFNTYRFSANSVTNSSNVCF